MKANDFSDNAPGRLVPTIEEAAAFVPEPLPDTLEIDNEMARHLARAERAVGRLWGMASGEGLNPHLVSAPFLRREAILSSKIEGTITTPEQLVLMEAEAEATGERSGDRETQEVANYIGAMRFGLGAIEDDSPVTLRLIRNMHHVLLEGVRGERERPGEFRTHQNWIGSYPNEPIAKARFVPPPASALNDALRDLERYINRRQKTDTDPLLIQLALIHYQFEAIHPFRDGNGRIGRLLIPLLMCKHGRLDSPMVYLSSFFEAHRDMYMDLLLRVSQTGDWNTWINFFLRAVLESAEDSIRRASLIREKRNEYRDQFGDASGRVLQIVDLLFQTPAITIQQAANALGVQDQTARYSITKLEEAGIIREVTSRRRHKVFIAHDLMDLMFQMPT